MSDNNPYAQPQSWTPPPSPSPPEPQFGAQGSGVDAKGSRVDGTVYNKTIVKNLPDGTSETHQQ